MFCEKRRYGRLSRSTLCYSIIGIAIVVFFYVNNCNSTTRVLVAIKEVTCDDPRERLGQGHSSGQGGGSPQSTDVDKKPVSSHNESKPQSSSKKESKKPSKKVNSAPKSKPANLDYKPPWLEDIVRAPSIFDNEGKRCPSQVAFDSLSKALKSQASEDKVIVLPSVVDAGYLDVALNFYEFNLHRLNITNFLFMCINKDACDNLQKFCIPAFLFTESAESGAAHRFGTKQFANKANVKSQIVKESLECGYTALLTDLDIVFLKNPFDFFPCQTCDIQIQTDKEAEDELVLNSGFILVRNTQPSKMAFSMAINESRKNAKTYHQKIINKVLKTLWKEKKLSMKVLSTAEWPSGMYYFGVSAAESRWFYYERPCEECIIVHNNWAYELDSKIYRFKEHLMWVVDRDGYYSDPNKKYITYSHPISSHKSLRTLEKAALRNALLLAELTNRILILPMFTFCHRLCPLNRLVKMDKFNQHFGSMYRESTFLMNPRVAPNLAKSRSPSLLIQNVNISKTIPFKDVDPGYRYEPRNLDSDSELERLLKWLVQFSNYSILAFHSLYDVNFPSGNYFLKFNDTGLL